jgi:hypothetical protein
MPEVQAATKTSRFGTSKASIAWSLKCDASSSQNDSLIHDACKSTKRVYIKVGFEVRTSARLGMESWQAIIGASISATVAASEDH